MASVNAEIIRKTQAILEKEAKRLKKMIATEVGNYYGSYSPTVYDRTFGLINSLKIDKAYHDGQYLIVKIYFDPTMGMATQPSKMGGDPGFTPILINYGWRWKRRTGPYRFAYYEGFYFWGRALEKFNANNPYKLRIDASMSYKGKVVSHHSYQATR